MSGPEGMDQGLDTNVQEVPRKPSQFERLRQRRQAIASRKFKEIAIPGYNGELVAIYKLLPWERIRAIVRRMEQDKHSGDIRELYVQVDTLVDACVEIKYRDRSLPAEEQLVPLVEGQVVRYDAVLAEILGFDYLRPRQCVLETFKNDFAISAHHGELIEWMQGSSDETDQEFLGESEGPLN